MVKVTKAATKTPGQLELLELIQQGLKSGEGPLKDLFGKFNEKDFEEGVSQPALKQFQEEILPMLNEKFIAGGQVGGSGMQRANVRGAKDLAASLASLKYNAQQQQLQNRQTGLQTALGTQPFENIVKQPSQRTGGGWGGVLGKLTSTITNPIGTAVGNLFGNAISG